MMIFPSSSAGKSKLTVSADQVYKESVQFRRRVLDVGGESLYGALCVSEEKTACALKLSSSVRVVGAIL